MPWVVELADEFEAEFDGLPEAVQDELLAQTKVIEQFGPLANDPAPMLSMGPGTRT